MFFIEKKSKRKKNEIEKKSMETVFLPFPSNYLLVARQSYSFIRLSSLHTDSRMQQWYREPLSLVQ